jgi:hypothetical protein
MAMLLNTPMNGFKQWCEFAEMIPYLLGIYPINEHSIDQSWIDEVVANPRFRQWLQSVGVTEPLGKAMSGSVGVAYVAGDYIVKFTSDRKEADAAAVVQGYDSPNLAKVHDVKRVGTRDDQFGGKKHLFAIVQEKVNTDVSKRHRMAGQAIYDYLDHNAGFIRGPIATILPAVLDHLPHKWKNDRSTIALVQQMLEKIKKIQDERGFLTQDTHGANIGMKGREPAFFDLGRSSIDFDNPATHSARVGQL